MHRKSVYFLLLSVAILIAIGCVMLLSTSPYAGPRTQDPMFFIKRQALWLAVGVVAGMIVASGDYHFLERTWRWWFGASIILLILCFVPGIGMQIKGSSRWLNLRVSSFQPSEFAKLTVVMAIAAWYARKDVDARGLVRGFLAPVALTALPLCLIAPEVDMGTTALIGATMLAIMFVAGARVTFLGPSVIAGLSGILIAASHMPERFGRLTAFQNLEAHRLGAGWQQWQARAAFITGGVDGLGLGNGRQKLLSLPEAHTDFIFSMAGEELGLRCTLLIVFCYVVIILCGFLIAMNARDRFGMLLGFGVVVLIALQAIVNIGVNVALLPNKGLPLPFVSYGGSNLLFCLLSVGVLINIYRQGLSEKEARQGAVLRVRTHRRKLAVRI